MAKRTPTDPSAAPAPDAVPAPSGRRARARRETAELTVVTERTRTSGFWGNRPPRAMSEAVTMISGDPAPKPTTTTARAPTANARRPSTSDDFLEEVATDVLTSE
ncbi:MAG: hypothetical protein IPQ07_28055 [Myxococcales bacterium]|nr:hypothetical protein [Myxococcales bacterium]